MVTDAARPDAGVRGRWRDGPVRRARAGDHAGVPGGAEWRGVRYVIGRSSAFGVGVPTGRGIGPAQVPPPDPQIARGLHDAPATGARGIQAGGDRVTAAGGGLGDTIGQGHELGLGGGALAIGGQDLLGLKPGQAAVRRAP